MEAKLSRSETKRRAILAAAKKAFQEEGYQATSMDQIARLAEVSKRTVYNHFESKDALIMHLLGELWRSATQPQHVGFDAATSLRDQLVQLLVRELDVLSSEEFVSLNRVAFGYFFFEPEALKKELERMGLQESALVQWLKAAEQAGALKPLEPELAASQLHSLIKGEAFWPQLIGMAPPLDESARLALAQRSTDMFLSYYRV